MHKTSFFSVPRFVLVKVSILLCLGCVYSQNNYKSYDDLAKQADKLFKKENYVEAKPLFSQLVSIKYSNPDFHYKYGTCLLFADQNKKKAIFHLQYAAKNSKVDPFAYYYLGKAFHYGYKFNKAIANYEKFISLIGDKEAKKLGVAREIEMCKNGTKLFKNQSEIVVLEKKETDEKGFYRYFDLSGIGGQILVKPSDFDLSQDKKKDHKTLIHFPKNSNTLYFSSYGDNDEFGKDIYQVTRGPDGKWGEPIKVLGAVNTPYDEDYPFFHPDGRTLYFCSKGHNSMGGYDLYKAELNPFTGAFENPVNLDFAINTPNDDFFFISDSTNNIAYFASGRSSVTGKVNVYKIKVKKFPVQSIVAKGNFVSEAHNNNHKGTIVIEDVNTKVKIGTYSPDSLTGNYLLSFPKRGKYRLMLDSEGSDYTHAGIIEIPSDKNVVSFVQELKLVKEDGVEKLLISNNFDEGIDASVASDVYLKRADLEVNYNAFYDDLDEAIEDMDEEDAGASPREVSSRLQQIRIKADTLAQGINLLNKIINKSYSEASQRNEMATAKAKEAKEISDKIAKGVFSEDLRAQELLKVDRLKKESQVHSQEAVTAYTMAKGFEREAKKQKDVLEELKGEFKTLSDTVLVVDNTSTQFSQQEIAQVFSREVEIEVEKKIESANKYVERTKNGLKNIKEEKKNLKYEIASKKQQLSAVKKKKDKKKIEDELLVLERNLADLEENIPLNKREAVKAKEKLQSVKFEKSFANELKQELRDIGDYVKIDEEEKLQLSKAMVATTTLEEKIKVSRTDLKNAKDKYPNLYYGDVDLDENLGIDEADMTGVEEESDEFLDEEIEEGNDGESEETNPDNRGQGDPDMSINTENVPDNSDDFGLFDSEKNYDTKNIGYESAKISGNKQEEKNIDNRNAKNNEDPLAIDDLEQGSSENQLLYESAEENVSVNNNNADGKSPIDGDVIEDIDDKAFNTGDIRGEESPDLVLDPPVEGIWYDETLLDRGMPGDSSFANPNDPVLGGWDELNVNDWLNDYKEKKAALENQKLKKKEKREERIVLNERYLEQSDVLLKRANIAYRATDSPFEKEELAQEIQLLESFQVDATTALMSSDKRRKGKRKKDIEHDIAKNKNEVLLDENLANEVDAADRTEVIGSSTMGVDSTIASINESSTKMDEEPFVENEDGLPLFKVVNEPQSQVKQEDVLSREVVVNQAEESKDEEQVLVQNEIVPEELEERTIVKGDADNKLAQKENPEVVNGLTVKLDSLNALKDESENKKELKSIEKQAERVQEQIAIEKSDYLQEQIVANRDRLEEAKKEINNWEAQRLDGGENNSQFKEEDVEKESLYQAEIKKNIEARDDLLKQVDKLERKAEKVKSEREKLAVLQDAKNKIDMANLVQYDIVSLAKKSDSINGIKTVLSTPKEEVASLTKANLAFNNVEEERPAQKMDEENSIVNQKEEERLRSQEKSEELKITVAQLEDELKGTKKKKKRKALTQKIEVLKKQALYFESKAKVESNEVNSASRAEEVDSIVAGSYINEIELDEGEQYTYNEIGVIKEFLERKDGIRSNKELNQQKISALEIGAGNYLKQASGALTSLNELDKSDSNYDTKKEALLKESRKWNEMAKINYAKSDSIKKENKSLTYKLKEVKKEERDYVGKLDETRLKKVMEAIVSNNFVKAPEPEAEPKQEEVVEEVLINESAEEEKEGDSDVLSDKSTTQRVKPSVPVVKSSSTKKDNLAISKSSEIPDYLPNDLRDLLAIPKRLRGEVFSSTNESVYNDDYPIPIDPVMPQGVVFKVQIGAFRKPIPQNLFKEFAPVMGESSSTGLTRYSAGMFTNLDVANEAKAKIRSFGYSDAFVIAFYNGERVSFKKAMAILRGETPQEENNVANANIKQNDSKQKLNTQKVVASQNSTIEENKTDVWVATPNSNQESPKSKSSIDKIESYDAYVNNKILKSSTKIEQVKGLFYTVQIGAFSTPKRTYDLMGIKPLNTHYTKRGMICYSTGIYQNIKNAEGRKDEMVELGIKDAFVTAYYNGKRMVPQVALRMQQSKGDVVMAKKVNSSVSVPKAKITNKNIVSNSNTSINALVEKYKYNEETDRLSFKVYIGSYTNEIPVKAAAVMLKLMDQGIESEKKNNGTTVYTSGNFSNFESAYDLQKLFIKEGLVNVKIISTLNDMQIPVKDAIELLNK